MGGRVGGGGVISLTNGLLEEGLLERFSLYLYVCMSGIFDRVGISVKLSIQVNVILQI